MQEKKSNLIGFIYLLAPAIALFFLFYPSVGFQPAQILSNGDPMAPWAAAIVGLVPGYILYKRVVTVRGHEWHRVQALKKLSKHYKNEESGAWENNQNITLRTTQGSVEVGALTQSALEKMQGKVGDLMMDNLDASAEIESKAEIDLLADRDHVNLAAARMRGDDSLENKVKKTTVAESKSSLMDNVLDWIASKISKNKAKNVKKDIISESNLVVENTKNQSFSTGASEYDNLVSNSWHCRSCGHMNSIDTNYCDVCGSSK